MPDRSQPKLILASGSPRRRELLALLGLDFRVLVAGVDERNHADETPAEMVHRLSRAKARAVAAQAARGIVIAADTIVVLDGAVLGKPATPAEARRMLRALRGRRHQVLSGITLIRRPDGLEVSESVVSEVEMRGYASAEIEAYVASGDPLDKAGAYAIQHAGFNPVARIVGCYASVMGFPLCHVARALSRLGVTGFEPPAPACQAATGYACTFYATLAGGLSC